MSMCQKEKYTKSMSQFAEELNIRIVYSSLAGFMDKYMSKVRTKYIECSFRERILTQEEVQIINVDDISVELDVTIEDIISKKVYVINRFSMFGDDEITLYIGAYFTAFIFRLRGQNFKHNYVSKIASLLDMSAFLKLLDVTSYTCRLYHAVVVSEADLWNVLDREAFQNVGANAINRQISETYQDEGFEIDLVRDLRRIITEGECEEYVSHITTIVHLPIPSECKLLPQDIESAVCAAEAETTLCFSKKL